jgi:hypothetical protein
VAGCHIVTIITIFDRRAGIRAPMHRIAVHKSIGGLLKRSDILPQELFYGVGRGIWMWAYKEIAPEGL